jgi:hypothetical protein
MNHLSRAGGNSWSGLLGNWDTRDSSCALLGETTERELWLELRGSSALQYNWFTVNTLLDSLDYLNPWWPFDSDAEYDSCDPANLPNSFMVAVAQRVNTVWLLFFQTRMELNQESRHMALFCLHLHVSMYLPRFILAFSNPRTWELDYSEHGDKQCESKTIESRDPRTSLLYYSVRCKIISLSCK